MITKYYDKIFNKVTNNLSSLALNKFIKSDYLRDTTSILPLTFLTIFIRASLNFLIVSRIHFNLYLLDFIFSIFITVVLAFFSPYIYHHIEKSYDEEIKHFSKLVIDSYWDEGWSFIERWKSIILGSSGVFIIFSLFFIEINSSMIQEFIFHTMLSSIIIDHLTKLKESIRMRKLKKDDSPIVIRIKEKPSNVLLRADLSYNNLELLSNTQEPVTERKEKRENDLNSDVMKNVPFNYSFIEDYKKA